MKNKKIISLLLAIILTFGMAVSASAAPAPEQEVMPLYTFIDYMISDIGISGSTLYSTCNFGINDSGTATVSVVIKKSATGSGSWSTYDSYSESVSCPYSGVIEADFSSAPAGYYYASVTLRFKNASDGRTESTTQKTSTIYKSA